MMTKSFLSETLNEKSRSYETPYQFLFKINDNIIVQRFFNVNIYNKSACSSLELKEAVDYGVATIKAVLKDNALDYMTQYKYYFEDDPFFDTNDSDDNYVFQVIIDGKIVIESGWSANIYPTKIRYDVNIKRLIGKIIYSIQSALCTPDKWLTTHYILTDSESHVFYEYNLKLD